MIKIGLDISGIKSIIFSVVGAVIAIVVGVTLGPTFTYYIGFINTTSMAGVELGSVLALVADYAPFFYYLGFAVLGLTAGYGASQRM